ncbi:heme-binding domain-containing protein [Leptospira ilyithenensis]|uniref:Heme-binding protein n=1 Tax=Leptospira ilyithenensis TaxID=2484901 RepID=A0A4R9LMK7_9LEPT|nr:heme-binding domain-containing protein [Leptospira ilyithenensis]TGN08204.1 heme-binding protein [Leptospira ilyithenensis]
MKRVTYLFLILSVLVQFIPVERDNPEESAPIRADSKLNSILERSCYDCHSHKTKWPIYSYVFPVSYFVSNHVKEGREELNFSEWEKLSIDKKIKKADSILEAVEEEEMPLKSYTWIHRDAVIGEEDIKILKDWISALEEESEKESL